VTTGLGLALLLDRYALRLLPWPPFAWKKEVGVRTGCFLGGALTFYLLRPGIVPLWEAVYRGLMVCLVAFLLEQLLRLVTVLRGRGQFGLGLKSLVLAGLVLLIPVLAALHPLHTVPKRTPGAFGLAFEDVRFRSADGIELAAWLIPHAQPRGNVIFCHGHGRNRGHVAGLLETFNDLGLNVLAFDFRGHGDSAGHTSTFGHQEVQDLQAAVTYLSARCPNQPLLLAGVSLGAVVSLKALPQLPNVCGLWSEGAFARFDHAVNQEFAMLPGFLRKPLVAAYYRLGWLDCGLWGPSINPIDQLPGVAVPIFFCHGKQDELVPVSDGQALYNTYAGPKGYWWVEGASHYNVRQQNPKEYLGRLRMFIEDCLRRKTKGTQLGLTVAKDKKRRD
jgi:alpha-beta hydrolase superfamily lysophospholipase